LISHDQGIELCKKYAQQEGVPLDIALTTVEAESNFTNVMGDSGRAFGYGQVWIKWHFARLIEAADALKITLPSRVAPVTEAEELKYKPLVLGNDNLSMLMAIKTIKSFWSAYGNGGFDAFNVKYVGPNISQAELSRRRTIRTKYTNSVPDTVNLSALATQAQNQAASLGADELVMYAAVGLAGMTVFSILSKK